MRRGERERQKKYVYILYMSGYFRMCKKRASGDHSSRPIFGRVVLASLGKSRSSPPFLSTENKRNERGTRGVRENLLLSFLFSPVGRFTYIGRFIRMPGHPHMIRPCVGDCPPRIDLNAGPDARALRQCRGSGQWKDFPLRFGFSRPRYAAFRIKSGV